MSRSKPQDAWKGTDGPIAEDIGTMPSIAAQFADLSTSRRSAVGMKKL